MKCRLILKQKMHFKWIASDIPRGLATGLASEYDEKIFLALRFLAVLPEGVFNKTTEFAGFFLL